MAEVEFRAVGFTEHEPGRWRGRTRRFGISHSVLAGAAAIAAAVYSANMRPVLAVVEQAGVNVAQARQAIEMARHTNARGALELKEAVDKANVIKAAVAADVPAAFLVEGISFTEVGGQTSAVIRKPMPGVTVHYTVSGTDGYYDSGARQTDEQGSVSFQIPRPHQSGVRDSISVWAVRSGKTAQTTYVW